MIVRYLSYDGIPLNPVNLSWLARKKLSRISKMVGHYEQCKCLMIIYGESQRMEKEKTRRATAYIFWNYLLFNFLVTFITILWALTNVFHHTIGKLYKLKKHHEMIVIFVNYIAVMCKMCPSYFLLYYFYERFSSERTEVSFCE